MSLKEAYPYYLGNKPVYANQDLVVTNKYTLQPATKAIAKAVEAAPKLAALGAWQRKLILEKVVTAMKERAEELAIALCIEAGKPIKDARGEVTRGIETFTIAMEEAVRITGDALPLDISQRTHGYSGLVKKFPIGPVSMIAPFNFPINLAAHKIAPALAVGVPWVLKPASQTPVGALLLAEILSSIPELPEGSFSVLPCRRDSADLFTVDDRFKLLSFTGSPVVGWDLKARAGKKKVVLELGGNAAVIVDETADIDDAVRHCIIGAFYQSGQSCISVQRIYCHAARYEAFKAKLVEAAAALPYGDPLQESTFIGPLITTADATRVEEWVQEAVGRGAKVLCGGKKHGPIYEATIVEGVTRGCKLYDDEVFGPAATLEPFESFKDAVARVNDSVFGLQAGVFTKNWDHAWYAFEHLEVGGVVIGDVPSVRIDSMPYGGVKDSGIGREGVRYAMEDMMEPRIMVMKNAGVF